MSVPRLPSAQVGAPCLRVGDVFSSRQHLREPCRGEGGLRGTVTLIQMRARALDPHLGHWLSRDSAGYVDGLNLYEYVASKPLRAVDPSGNDAVTIGWAAAVLVAKNLDEKEEEPIEPPPPGPPPPPDQDEQMCEARKCELRYARYAVYAIENYPPTLWRIGRDIGTNFSRGLGDCETGYCTHDFSAELQPQFLSDTGWRAVIRSQEPELYDHWHCPDLPGDWPVWLGPGILGRRRGRSVVRVHQVSYTSCTDLTMSKVAHWKAVPCLDPNAMKAPRVELWCGCGCP